MNSGPILDKPSGTQFSMLDTLTTEGMLHEEEGNKDLHGQTFIGKEVRSPKRVILLSMQNVPLPIHSHSSFQTKHIPVERDCLQNHAINKMPTLVKSSAVGTPGKDET